MKKRILILAAVFCLAVVPASAAEPETTSVSATAASAEEMSDDIYSFQIKIDGQLYQFPMKYKEFEEKGWKFDGIDSNEKIEPNSYGSVGMKLGRVNAMVTFINFGINTKPLSECYVAGISLDEYYMEDQMSFELPKGITYHVSTREDVEAAYGPASDVYESDYYVKLTYELADYYSRVEIYIDTESKTVNEVSVRCLTVPEDLEEDEVSEEVPEVVTQYQAPAELGDNLSSCIAEIDGFLYKIPAPVSAFLENGWKLLYNDNSEVIAGKDSGYGYYLTKDNQKFRIGIRNYAENATAAENCFVVEIYNDDFSTVIPVKLQKGITFGMNTADLEAALEGTVYEKNDMSSIASYFIPSFDDKYYGVTITVDKEEDKVIKIALDRSPKEENLFD